MRRFQTGPPGQFATYHSGWSRAKDVPRLATAIFQDRVRENPGGTRVGGLHAGWLVSLPRGSEELPSRGAEPRRGAGYAL